MEEGWGMVWFGFGTFLHRLQVVAAFFEVLGDDALDFKVLMLFPRETVDTRGIPLEGVCLAAVDMFERVVDDFVALKRLLYLE